MVLYIIKSVACLGVFLLAYHFFLERERMHRFNRWYLLIAVLAALTVPLARFTVSQNAVPVLQNRFFELLGDGGLLSNEQQPVPAAAPSQVVQTFTADTSPQSHVPVWLAVYVVVASVLLIRFTRNMYRLLAATYRNRVIHQRDATLVLVKNSIASYSFLNYIFISEEEFTDSSLEEELLTHELTHVRQKHSYDVIFIELLQIFFWFNPLLPFCKKAIQLNHEYLADEAVVKVYEDVPAYQCLLLAKASRNSYAYLTSNFNYSVTKKRLLMLTLHNNPLRATFKQISVLPLLALSVFFFSSRNIVLAQNAKEKTPRQTTASATAPPLIFPDMSGIPAGQGLTDAELKEYNSLASSAVTKPSSGARKPGKFTGTPAERSRMLALFKKMDLTQRNDAFVIFAKKQAPLVKKVPTPENLEKWKEPKDYGVWIDGKKVSNETLNNYSASDFSYYMASNLAYTEKMKQDIMKRYHLNTMYKVQLNLYTNAAFASMTEQAKAAPEFTMMYHRSWDEEKKRPVSWSWAIDESR